MGWEHGMFMTHDIRGNNLEQDQELNRDSQKGCTTYS